MPTIKHLSYSNITLPLCPSFIEDKWLSVIHDQYTFQYADFWNFDGPNSQAIPTPSLPVPPKFKLDVLNWPTSASNPAFFHTIIETDRWNRISAVCAPSGYNTPQDLVFYDGRVGKSIAASMYICGAARPLNQLGHLFTDLWLLTLTDVRFYWYFARTQVTTPVSWSELYGQLGSALRTTIAFDTINAAYGTPSNKWALAYQAATPAILDAVATNVGQRVVVGLDGSVKTVNWQTARTAAGNYVDNINDRVISGGLIRESDIGKYVPASVNTLFPDSSAGPVSTSPHVVNNTLPSLSMNEYGTAPGVSGWVQTLYGDTAYDGTNTAIVNAYAAQAATDWYGWRLVDTDLVYPGIEPWVPTGWEGEIEWTLKLVENNPALGTPTGGDDPFTKTQIRRGPWTDTTVGNFYTPGGGSVVNNFPTQYIQQQEEPDDLQLIPGPQGSRGADGIDGRDGTPGPQAEEVEYVPIVPGPMGPQGYTGVGIQGPMGPEAEEAEYVPIVPGNQGERGFTGVGVIGPPGRDAEDTELPLIIPGPIGLPGRNAPIIPGRDGEDAEDNLVIPGPRGLTGLTGVGIQGPPGTDAEDAEDPLPIPGPYGPRGLPGRDGIPGSEGEEAEYPLVVPGQQGLRGYTGIGLIGPPGPEGEEPELPLVIPGPTGLQGLTGTGTPGPPGSDGEESEYTSIVPGQQGIAGLTGPSGSIGPPGQDGEDDDNPIIQLLTNITQSTSSLTSGAITDTTNVVFTNQGQLYSGGPILTLPSTGTYLILISLSIYGTLTSGVGYVSTFVVVNGATSGSAYANTITTTSLINKTVTMFVIVTANSGTTISGGGSRGSASWAAGLAGINSSPFYSTLSYIKIS